MNSPLEKGSHEGRVFKKEEFEFARKLYYQLRGWDEKGVPTRKKLAELGLDSI